MSGLLSKFAVCQIFSPIVAAWSPHPSLFTCRCLDKAAVDGPGPQVSRTYVEETKAFLGIMPLFLCICIYQVCGVDFR